jgi:hypothetical protein
MRQVLTFLGLVTGIGPLLTAFRTRWDSFDAYGSVPPRESAILRLPAGPISIAFEGGRNSRGVAEDLPTIASTAGRELPVRLIGGLQGPSATRRGPFGDDRKRKRFATTEVPADGDFVVTAGACTVLLGTAGFRRKS